MKALKTYIIERFTSKENPINILNRTINNNNDLKDMFLDYLNAVYPDETITSEMYTSTIRHEQHYKVIDYKFKNQKNEIYQMFRITIDDVAKYYIMQVLTFDEENRIWNYGKEHYLPLQNNIFDVLNRMNNEITKLLKL